MVDFLKEKLERFCFRKLRKLFAGWGYYIGKATPKEQIKSLIKNLHPYTTDKELIRIGAIRDGGYLVPNDLEGIEACFSPGVGAISKFEEDCLSYGMKTYLADASVNGLSIENDQLHFTKKFIGAYDDEEYMTLDSWVESSGISNGTDLLLQMDIEGFEYQSLLNTSNDLLMRFRLIVLEVHHLDCLWDEKFFQTASAFFNKLLVHHSCVHIHPNNTSSIVKINDIEIVPTIEVTFLRNDRIKFKSPTLQFPHPLDTDNTDRERIILPKIWYKTKSFNIIQ